MPLLVAPVERDLKIVKIITDDRTKKHLENLGLTVNAVIRLLSVSGGSAICLVKDCKLALDTELSHHIFVA